MKKNKFFMRQCKTLLLKYRKLYNDAPQMAKGCILECMRGVRHLYDLAASKPQDEEWIDTPLDDLSLSERFKTIDQWFKVFGLLISSLGDDTASLHVVSPNHALAEYTNIYIKLAGWIVEVKKSLGSPFNGEYLREQPHCMFVTKVKSFAPLSTIPMESFVNNIIICKPVHTVNRSNFGVENLESKSPLIREIGKIARLLNLNLHPRIDIVIQGYVSNGVSEFGLFTQPFDYVPMRCLAAWKAAGKPEHSEWHLRIENLRKGLSVAGDDALFLEEMHNMPKSKSGADALTRAIGQSWTKSQMEDYEFSRYLPSTRLCRYIDAVNAGDQVAAKKVIDEVVELQSDIIYKYNYPEVEEVEELTTFTPTA